MILFVFHFFFELILRFRWNWICEKSSHSNGDWNSVSIRMENKFASKLEDKNDVADFKQTRALLKPSFWSRVHGTKTVLKSLLEKVNQRWVSFLIPGSWMKRVVCGLRSAQIVQHWSTTTNIKRISNLQSFRCILICVLVGNYATHKVKSATILFSVIHDWTGYSFLRISFIYHIVRHIIDYYLLLLVFVNVLYEPLCNIFKWIFWFL